MTDTTLVERLRGLIERLEKAEAGSRELDWLIAEALGEIPEHRVMETGWDYIWFRRSGEFALWKAMDSEGRLVELWQAPQRSTSLDAAVALIGRVLPEWKKQLFENWDGLWIARVTSARRTFGTDYMRERAPAGSPNGAIALLIAALEALAYEQSK